MHLEGGRPNMPIDRERMSVLFLLCYMIDSLATCMLRRMLLYYTMDDIFGLIKKTCFIFVIVIRGHTRTYCDHRMGAVFKFENNISENFFFN